MAIQTVNFLRDATVDDIKNLQREYDNRNSIACFRAGDVNDYELIYNYIDFLNARQYQFQNFGYLNMGMICLNYVPSFVDQKIKSELENYARRLNIPMHVTHAQSVLTTTNFCSDKDIWVFKEDLANIINKPKWEISVKDYFDLVFSKKEDEEFAKV